MRTPWLRADGQRERLRVCENARYERCGDTSSATIEVFNAVLASLKSTLLRSRQTSLKVDVNGDSKTQRSSRTFIWRRRPVCAATAPATFAMGGAWRIGLVFATLLLGAMVRLRDGYHSSSLSLGLRPPVSFRRELIFSATSRPRKLAPASAVTHRVCSSNLAEPLTPSAGCENSTYTIEVSSCAMCTGTQCLIFIGCQGANYVTSSCTGTLGRRSFSTDTI